MRGAPPNSSAIEPTDQGLSKPPLSPAEPAGADGEAGASNATPLEGKLGSGEAMAGLVGAKLGNVVGWLRGGISAVKDRLSDTVAGGVDIAYSRSRDSRRDRFLQETQALLQRARQAAARGSADSSPALRSGTYVVVSAAGPGPDGAVGCVIAREGGAGGASDDEAEDGATDDSIARRPSAPPSTPTPRAENRYVVRLLSGQSILATRAQLSALSSPVEGLSPSVTPALNTTTTTGSLRREGGPIRPPNSTPMSTPGRPSGLTTPGAGLSPFLLPAAAPPPIELKLDGPLLTGVRTARKDGTSATAPPRDRYISFRSWFGRPPRMTLGISAGRPLLDGASPAATDAEARRAARLRIDAKLVMPESLLPPKRFRERAGEPSTSASAGQATPTKKGPAKRGLFRRLFQWGRGADSESDGPRTRSASVSAKGTGTKSPPPSTTRTDDLKKVLERFRAAVDRHEQCMLTLQSDRAATIATARRETRRWRRYALRPLEALCQRLLAMRLASITARLDLEFQTSQCFVNAAADVQKALRDPGRDLARDWLRGAPLAALIAAETSELDAIVEFPEMRRKRQACARLAAQASALDTEYKELSAKLLAAEPFSVRRARLQSLLRRGDEAAEWIPAYQFYWRQRDEHTRELFRSLILDSRQSEGQLVRRWRSLLRASGPQSVSPDAVTAFFAHIIAQIAQRYSVSGRRPLRALALLTYRLIYPYIGDVVTALQTPGEAAMDAALFQAVTALGGGSPSRLGVHAQFLPPEATSRVDFKETQVQHRETLQFLVTPESTPLLSPSPDPIAEAEEHPPPLTLSVPAPQPAAPTSGGSSGGVQMRDDIVCYPKSIATLQSLEDYQNVPCDLLHCMLRVLRAVKAEALEYQKANLAENTKSESKSKSNSAKREPEMLNADALFPIVVLVVARAAPPCLFRSLGTIERFVSDRHRTFGQTGMAVSVLRAAGTFIVRADPTAYSRRGPKTRRPAPPAKPPTPPAPRPAVGMGSPSQQAGPGLELPSRPPPAPSPLALTVDSDESGTNSTAPFTAAAAAAILSTFESLSSPSSASRSPVQTSVKGRRRGHSRSMGSLGSAHSGVGRPSLAPRLKAERRKPRRESLGSDAERKIGKSDVAKVVKRHREAEALRRVEKSLAEAGFL